jgi:hypothetical protein
LPIFGGKTTKKATFVVQVSDFLEYICGMRIGVIIPDRGDRPEFLANCLRMLKRQTVKPVGIALINFPPTSNEKDITTRYRVGYSKWSASSCDVIALIENDDYYAPTYLEKMYKAWVAAN